MMADGRWQVLQGDLYMQIDRSIVLEKFLVVCLLFALFEACNKSRAEISIYRTIRATG